MRWELWKSKYHEGSVNKRSGTLIIKYFKDSAKAMKKVKEKIKKVKFQVDQSMKSMKDQGEKAWIVAIGLMGDSSRYVSETDFVSRMNTYTSKISEAMDKGFKMGTIDKETGLSFTPKNHRILDEGHGFFESIQRARETGEQEGFTQMETFTGWFQSYFSDMSSPAGMPAFGSMSDEVYGFLRSMGFSESTARDVVTINGHEAIEGLLGGTVACVGLLLAWKKEDKQNFSKTLGALGVGAAVSMNPVVLVMVVVGAALGYNKMVCRKSVGKGGTVASAAMITSFLIPGPLLLGVVPAIVLSVYLNKKIKDEFDITEQMKIFLFKVKDEKSREQITDSFNLIFEKIREGKKTKVA